MSASSATQPGVVERVQNFVSENKRVVIIGAVVAAAAIGGAAYYASSSSRAAIDAAEKAERKKGKKKSGKSSPSSAPASKKKKPVNEPDGPILEEVEPKAADGADGASKCFDHAINMAADQTTCVISQS